MPPKLNFVSDGHQTPYSIVSRVFRNAVKTNNAYNTIRKHVQNWVRVKTVELKPNTNFGAFEIKIAPQYIGSVAVSDIKKVVHSCYMHALKSIPEIYSNFKFLRVWPVLLLYVLILDSYMVGNDELSSLAQVTNEDTACLTPTIVDAEDLIGCDPYSDSAEREVDPEKTKRKIDRLLTVLKPYDVPEKLVSGGHRGSVDPFRTFSTH